MIYSLDLGVRCGWAYGKPGDSASLMSGAVVLKQPDDLRAVAFSNLICFLNDCWAEHRPSLIVKEKMLPLQAFRHLGNAEHTVRMTAGLHAIVEAMAVRFGIRCEDVADSTVRKHFLGVARLGTRAETKAAVVQRAHLLKLMPADSRDDNRADALALHDYACATFGRVSGGDLLLFGETT